MGRGKRAERPSRLFPLPIVPRALSIFPLLLSLLGHPAGASAEERVSPRRLKTNKNSGEMHKPIPTEQRVEDERGKKKKKQRNKEMESRQEGAKDPLRELLINSFFPICTF